MNAILNERSENVPPIRAAAWKSPTSEHAHPRIGLGLTLHSVAIGTPSIAVPVRNG